MNLSPTWLFYYFISVHGCRRAGEATNYTFYSNVYRTLHQHGVFYTIFSYYWYIKRGRPANKQRIEELELMLNGLFFKTMRKYIIIFEFFQCCKQLLVAYQLMCIGFWRCARVWSNFENIRPRARIIQKLLVKYLLETESEKKSGKKSDNITFILIALSRHIYLNDEMTISLDNERDIIKLRLIVSIAFVM